MQPLLLTDYPIVQPFLDLADYEGYNSNFVTMMMWNHEYHLEYEVHEHFLVMLHHFNGMTYFSMPYTSPEYYREAMDYMIAYSKQHHFPFMIDFAIAPVVKKLKEIYGDELIFQRTRDFDDYVYDRKILETLSGKKMQKRRNHYNAFVKEYPDHEYRPLSIDDDFALILECLTKWEKDREATMSLTSEVYGILYLLSSNHILDIKLGGIFIHNQLKAFIIASPLKHNTIQIHVEKADNSIRGLYPAILKEFLEHEFPGYQYVNREEDLGLENLRISKTRLHPVHMVEKSRIWLNNSCIRKARDEDVNELKALWLKCFEDEDEVSSDFYFSHRYNKDYTYVTIFQERIISAMTIEPFKTNNYPDAYFILGVMTEKTFEGQGIMSRMMKKVLDDYQGKRIYLQAYHPVIYEKFGFHQSHLIKEVVVDQRAYNQPSILTNSQDTRYLAELYQGFIKNYNEYFVRDCGYYEYFYIPRAKAFHQSIMTFMFEDQPVGYMTFEEYDSHILVVELIYISHLNDIIKLICQIFNRKIIIHADINARIQATKETMKINLMCNQDSEDSLTSRYINEVY